MKRTVAFIGALLCFIFSLSFSAFAHDDLCIPTLEGFTSYWKYNSNSPISSVAERLSMTAEQLESYCEENNVWFISVDDENARQVRLTVDNTDFSESTVNISYYTKKEIKSFASELTGSKKYKLVDKKSQKFIKTTQELSDNGGEYTLTQYITVANKKIYTLSFYTSDSVKDDGYIEETFNGYIVSGFIERTVSLRQKLYYALIVAGILGFTSLGGFITYTIIKDIKKTKQ